MAITITPPKNVAIAEFVCDRCGRKALTEIDNLLPSGAISENEPVPVPDGWQSVVHPDGDIEQLLVFDRQACMSVWFATFVRVLYGGPAELPKRRTSGPGRILELDPDQLPLP